MRYAHIVGECSALLVEGVSSKGHEGPRRGVRSDQLRCQPVDFWFRLGFVSVSFWLQPALGPPKAAQGPAETKTKPTRDQDETKNRPADTENWSDRTRRSGPRGPD